MSDRISELPDVILGQILSLLETKYAASTMALSKRWKLVWTSVSTLHFDQNSFCYQYKRGDQFRRRLFGDCIPEVLARRDKTLALDKLIFITNKSPSCVFADDVLDYAMSDGLKHLQVSMPNGSPLDFSGVISVLNSQVVPMSLRILKLTAVGYTSIDALLCLPSLEILHLENFKLGPNLLTECANMVELSIVCCAISSGEEQIIICAPQLGSLRISNLRTSYPGIRPIVRLVLPKLTSFKLKSDSYNIPEIQTDDFVHLKTGIVNIRNEIDEQEVTMNIVQKLCHAQHLTLSLPTLEFLLKIAGSLGVPLSPFSNLKTFRVTTKEAGAESGVLKTMSISVINQLLNTIFQCSSAVELFVVLPETVSASKELIQQSFC